MPDELESVPDNPELLYDDRNGDHISCALPYNQGDIFRCGRIEGHECFVMLFMHPCTMRSGVGIREHQTVIKVTQRSSKKVLAGNAHWVRDFKVMPLPDLLDDGKSAYQGDFMSIWTLPSSQLPRTERIAQLSQLGRRIFQQRLIFHLTRFAPSLDVLAEACRPVDAEIELQAEWVAMGMRHKNSDQLSLIEKLENDFDEFLRQKMEGDDLSVRDLLGKDEYASEAQKYVYSEIQRRFS